MNNIWVALGATLIAWIAYTALSSRLKSKRLQTEREQIMPSVEFAIQTGTDYNVKLNDGKTLVGVQFLGISKAHSDDFGIGGWAGMLVLLSADGRKIFLRKSSVRYIEELAFSSDLRVTK